MLTQYKEVAMIHDVRKKPSVVDGIAWCNNSTKDLTKVDNDGGIKVKAVHLEDVEEAKNLVKALLKAIEFGWVK